MTLAYPSLEQVRGELRVGEEFLAKYNRPGPRYTSYPTAPVWNDSFGPGDLEKVFGEAESAKTPVSLYMHIPFCESLRQLGFNRLSMGIQDFQPEVQKAVHRLQPLEMTRDLLLSARRLGFESINVDLIYGLPYQTPESFAHTVDQILGLSPDRIAL